MVKQINNRFIICPQCKGRGCVEERINLYESGGVTCSYCDGARVVREEETVTHHKIEISH